MLEQIRHLMDVSISKTHLEYAMVEDVKSFLTGDDNYGSLLRRIGTMVCGEPQGSAHLSADEMSISVDCVSIIEETRSV